MCKMCPQGWFLQIWSQIRIIGKKLWKILEGIIDKTKSIIGSGLAGITLIAFNSVTYYTQLMLRSIIGWSLYIS